MAPRARKTAEAQVDGQMSQGVGFEVGNRAPSVKYRDVDGKVSDKEPEGGGWIVVQEGDTVTPAIYAELNPKSAAVAADDSDDE